MEPLFPQYFFARFDNNNRYRAVTNYVLRHLRPHIKPGTFIYFDELNHLEHEPGALDEFMAQSGLKFRVVSADKTMAFVFFECVGEVVQK